MKQTQQRSNAALSLSFSCSGPGGEVNMHTDIVHGFNDRLLNSTVMLLNANEGE